MQEQNFGGKQCLGPETRNVRLRVGFGPGLARRCRGTRSGSFVLAWQVRTWVVCPASQRKGCAASREIIARPEPLSSR